MQLYQIILPEEVVNEKTINIDASESLEIERIKHIEYDRNIHTELKVDQTQYNKKYGFDLSDSEISNFLSHRAAWKQFQESGLPWALIIESNISLDISVDDIAQLIKELPQDWDMFFPYDIHSKHQDIQKRSNGRNLININAWEFSKTEPYLLGYKLGNSIYILSNSGAQKLLNVDLIDDRLDHMILKMAEDYTGLNIYSSDVNWFDMSQIEDYNWAERSKAIYRIAEEQSTWTEGRLNKARTLLKTISTIGLENDIDIVLEAGTLLGYIRHKGIMVWDDDIDIGIEEKKLDSFLNELSKVKNLRFGGEYKYKGTRFFKIWDVEGEHIDGHEYTFPFVDLWVYNEIGDDLVFEIGITHKDTIRLGFDEIIFEGAMYKIPKNSLDVLDSRFVDWRDTIRVYTWSHRYEKNHFKYLYIPIKTNEEGQMLGF